LLTAKGYNVTEVKQDILFVGFESKEQMGQINTLLNKNNYTVYSINKVQKDLENLFLDITQNT